MSLQASMGLRDSSEMDLRKGFDAFIEAARRLEQSHAALKSRADAVDLQLARTNRVLEQTLQERETIFSALPIGLIAVRPDGAVTFCNQEGERLCNWARSKDLELVTAAEGELEVDRTAVRVRRVALPDGGTLVLLEDRSQVAALEREVHRLDRLAGLSELALGIAHEVKNPLNGVMGFASMLERNPEPDCCRRYSAKIVEGLRQVDSIVKALLAFARPEQRVGRSSSIKTIVAEAAASAGLPSAHIRLRGDVERTSSDALTRVLTNLFRNSVEAAGKTVSLEVDVEGHDDHTEILVSDDGPGIDAELEQRIFEPFVSSKERGHGLGLALASRVLSFLGGSVALMDPGSEGATFRICIPRPATPGKVGEVAP